MGEGNEVGGDVAHERLFHLVGGVVALADETEAVADAEDVGVDSHCGLAEGYGLDDVGRLAAHAWQQEQLVHVGGHLAAVALNKHFCHFCQMAGFGIGVGHTLDILVDFFRLGLCHRVSIGELAEEAGCHEVDALVGTLCTEDDGDEQLEHAAELEFGVHLRHLLLEVV